MRRPPLQRTSLSRGYLLLVPLLSACADSLTTPQLPAPVAVRMTSAAEAFYGIVQRAEPGAAVVVAPAVVVEDAAGRPVAGVTVRFVVSEGAGTVDHTVVTSDAAGVASAGRWLLGADAGANEVTANVGSLPSVRFQAVSERPGFRVTIRYVQQTAPRHQQLIEYAVRRWESIVVADLSDHALNSPAGSCFTQQPALDETVDDVLLLVDIAALDGPGGYLGEAGPCYLRSGDLLPVMGYLRLDLADLERVETDGLAEDLVLHEVGHVLGVGTLWRAKSLLQGSGSGDPRVGGTHALAAYRALGGSEMDVPAENSGGPWTRDVHWRESVFADELMTGYIGYGVNPLSALTVGTLRDLGYGTRPEAASTYVMSRAQSSNHINLHEREQVVLPRFIVGARGRTDTVLR